MKISVKTVCVGLIIAALLGGCEDFKERTRFNGNYYPWRARTVDGNLNQFSVTVRRVSQGLEGARQAAEYQGIRYCIKNFGNSEIIWAAGPDRQLTQEDVKDNTLTVTGKCVGW